MGRMSIVIAALAALLASTTSLADSGRTAIPMSRQGGAAYYVQGTIPGYGPATFMVDTGSGYTVINQETLDVLQEQGGAAFVRTLQGVLADGSSVLVPVYKLERIGIGDSCVIEDVEAAVFPSARRPILGLSALQKVSPFQFSLEPPELTLSHCATAGKGRAWNAAVAEAAAEGVRTATD